MWLRPLNKNFNEIFRLIWSLIRTLLPLLVFLHIKYLHCEGHYIFVKSSVDITFVFNSPADRIGENLFKFNNQVPDKVA